MAGNIENIGAIMELNKGLRQRSPQVADSLMQAMASIGQLFMTEQKEDWASEINKFSQALDSVQSATRAFMSQADPVNIKRTYFLRDYLTEDDWPVIEAGRDVLDLVLRRERRGKWNSGALVLPERLTLSLTENGLAYEWDPFVGETRMAAVVLMVALPYLIADFVELVTRKAAEMVAAVNSLRRAIGRYDDAAVLAALD